MWDYMYITNCYFLLYATNICITNHNMMAIASINLTETSRNVQNGQCNGHM